MLARESVLWTLLAGAAVAKPSAYPPDEVDELQNIGVEKLKGWLAANPVNGNCTLQNAVRRQEWSDLSIPQRLEYIEAVKCLQSKPAITTPEAPGSRSRFDDYVAVHIQQTRINHRSTTFLPWHRYYLWHYEKALRDECGYRGYQPYWNWGRYAEDPANSPLFNGNDSSMSGNGVYVPGRPGVSVRGAPPPFDVIPPGEGGGCVTSGPFKDMKVSLGPVLATIPGVPVNPQSNGLGYNPRCLIRDLNQHSAAVTTSNYTYDLIVKNDLMFWFQSVLEGQFELGKWGVHAGGHFTVGGDPAGDLFVSPGDPIFWLHHGMVDRVWWIWQLQNFEARLKDVSFTLTMSNNPPSRNGTLNDPTNLGLLAGDVLIADLMNTMGGLNGELCYIYV